MESKKPSSRSKKRPSTRKIPQVRGWKSKYTKEKHKGLLEFVRTAARAIAKALSTEKDNESTEEKVEKHVDFFLGMHHKVSKVKLSKLYEKAGEHVKEKVDGAKEFLAEIGTPEDFFNLEVNLAVGPLQDRRSDDPDSGLDLFYYKSLAGESAPLTPRSSALQTMVHQLQQKDYRNALVTLQSAKSIGIGSYREKMSRASRSFQPSNEDHKNPNKNLAAYKKRARTPSPSRSRLQQQHEIKKEPTTPTKTTRASAKSASQDPQQKPSSRGSHKKAQPSTTATGASAKSAGKDPQQKPSPRGSRRSRR